MEDNREESRTKEGSRSTPQITMELMSELTQVESVLEWYSKVHY
jgi:hypothetical protein